MRFRVDGNIYDFTSLEDRKQDQLLREWHRSAAVECLCQGDHHDRNPLLYVKQVRDGLYFANYPSNSKNNITHDFRCRYNRHGYRKTLSDKGIQVGENEISCKLKFNTQPNRSDEAKMKPPTSKQSRGTTSTESIPTSTMKSLFLTMLQEFKVSEYRPGGRRNISNRLYKISEIIRVNQFRLHDMLYVAQNGKWPKLGEHHFIIGWGRRNVQVKPHPTYPHLIRMPIFSVDAPDTQVAELTILKKVFEECEYDDSDVETGYYLLYRGPLGKKDSSTRDRQLCFVSAELQTRIPVRNKSEEALIRFLYENEIHFERPLIGNVTEQFAESGPEIMIYQEPKVIVAVGDIEMANIQRKKLFYEQNGYRFLTWNDQDNKQEWLQKIKS